MFSWVHKKCSGIPGSGVNGVLDKLNQLMSDQWQRSQWVGRSLRWCHPSVTSGTAYPKVVLVNSLPLQDAVLHGANRMSSCPSSPPAHFPSPPDEEITIHASGAPGPCNRKLGPTLFDFHRLQCNDWGMICWAYSVTTKDQVSSQDLLERMQLDDQAKVLHRLRCHGYVEPSDGWLKEVMASTGSETHPSDSKAWSGRPRSAVRLDLPQY